MHSAQHLPKRDCERLVPDPWDDGTHAPPWKAGAECKYDFHEEAMTQGDVASVSVEISVLGGLVSELAEPEPALVAYEHWTGAQRSASRTSGPEAGTTGNGLLPSWDDARLSCVAWDPDYAFVRIVVYKHRARRVKQAIAYEMIPLSCLRTGYRSVPLLSPTCGSRIHDCSLLVHVSRQTCFVHHPSMSFARAGESPTSLDEALRTRTPSPVPDDAAPPMLQVPGDPHQKRAPWMKISNVSTMIDDLRRAVATPRASSQHQAPPADVAST